ncbi:MAG: hypothetical protein IPI42_07745 [Saprospiraceae bacterium]|nr:hypothetical protein [Candidatus Parvibacillus calidus]
MIRSGAAYIVVEGKSDDIYIAPGDLMGALDGDTVEVSVVRRKGRQKIRRQSYTYHTPLKGNIHGPNFVNKKYSVVTPFKTPDGFEILVFNEGLNGAEDGDIVTVRVIILLVRQTK